VRHLSVPRRARAILAICACLSWIPGCDRDWESDLKSGYCWITAVSECLRIVLAEISPTISKTTAAADVFDTAYLWAAAAATDRERIHAACAIMKPLKANSCLGFHWIVGSHAGSESGPSLRRPIAPHTPVRSPAVRISGRWSGPSSDNGLQREVEP
jgi:hypothetical protein